MKKLVVLASGQGTIFRYILEHLGKELPDTTVTALISDKSSCGAIDVAHSNDIQTIITRRWLKQAQNLEAAFEYTNADLYVMAGFLSILPPAVVQKWKLKIINTHPSLLPCFGGKGFYGEKVHAKVIESGAKITGCTVHFVTEDIDGGPIIAQKSVEVLDSDTPSSLADRVKPVERELLVSSIRALLFQKFRISGQRVMFS